MSKASEKNRRQTRSKYNPQKLANTPKWQRTRVAVEPTTALVDPMRTLGHAPRPRKGRRS